LFSSVAVSRNRPVFKFAEAVVFGTTVNAVEAMMLPTVAVIVVVPIVKEAARPLLLIVATAGAEEVQVAVELRFRVLPSE
jgi:hypothetical protein